MRPLVRVAASVAAVLAAAPAALAKPWTPPPAAELEPAPRPPSFEPDATSPPPRREPPRPPETPVHFVVKGGYDLGSSTQIVGAVLSDVYGLVPDASAPSMKANQAWNVGVGAAFLKLAGDRLVTQATIGFQHWSRSAAEGTITWRAIPLEVVEFAYLEPLRLGAGISYLVNPRLKGDGAASFVRVPFRDALGLVLEADWVARLPDPRNLGRGGRFTFGARYVLQKLEPNVAGGARRIDGNSFGFVVGYTG